MSNYNVIVAISFALNLMLAGNLVTAAPALDPDSRVSQSQIQNGELTLREIRFAGLKVFTTPFNHQDGYGDGAHDPSVSDTRDHTKGNRPTLQGNGTFLRVNGLDSQTCLECHSIISNAVIPARLGVGGVGGLNTSAMFQTGAIDVVGSNFDGVAGFTGRLINPPFLFGSGGVQLLAQEMTRELAELRDHAIANPGSEVALVTKGVDFGTIVAAANGDLDTSGAGGIDADLIVRPFGRKGEFATVRDFDIGALSFHMGMQSSEAFGGEFADADNDGVINEITMGDLSALSVFNTTMESPVRDKLGAAERKGFAAFKEIGCADCHRPMLPTTDTRLFYRTSVDPEPYYSVDLSAAPMKFPRHGGVGLKVKLFSDLKRHDMGEGLAESFDKVPEDVRRQYITARLWGVADTAPYMHDGRALTLREAIQAHDSPGSEASESAQAFRELPERSQNQLLSFLKTLRTPENPNEDVIPD